MYGPSLKSKWKGWSWGYKLSLQVQQCDKVRETVTVSSITYIEFYNTGFCGEQETQSVPIETVTIAGAR